VLEGAFEAHAASLCGAEFNKVTVRKTVGFSGTTSSGTHTGSGSQKEKGVWSQLPL
jgi:hypothetical protein